MKATKNRSEKNAKSKQKLSFLKKPVFYIPVSIFLVIVIVGITGILISRPGIARGEYDIQSIVDMLLNHDNRINDLEKKTDNTQTQANQNTEDIKKIQDNTGTAAATTVPAVNTPVTSSTPITQTPSPVVVTTQDPNKNSWTNQHGTYSWSALKTAQTLYLVKDTEFSVGYSFGPCGNNVRSIIIPATISAKMYGGGSTDETANYRFTFTGDQVRYFDTNHTELFNCSFSEWEIQLKNIVGDKNYPGVIGIWL